MRKFFTVAAAALLVSAGAFAQSTTVGDTISVTATVQGHFTFTIDQATFNFGNVNAAGDLDAGVTDVSVTPAGSSATYTNDTGSVTWSCESAPRRDVVVALTSGTTDLAYTYDTTVYTSAPAADANILKVRIPTTDHGNGTWQNFADTTSRTLVPSIEVGNGTNAIGGQLNFQLTVADTTPLGGYVWTVKLDATGSL